MNPYDALGVPKDAPPEKIKAAYRRKAKAAHPDAGGSPEKFGAITKAYRILSDETKRAKFDATGETDDAPDNADARAMDVIAQLLASVIDNPDAKYNDLVEGMRRTIDQNIAKAQADVAEGTRREAQAIDLRARFTAKGRNVITPIIDARIAEIKRIRNGVNEMMTTCQRARELLQGMKFTVEPPPTMMRYNVFGTSTTSTAR